MSSAAEWFEKGEAVVAMAYSADTGSEFRDDLQRAIDAFDHALALEPSHLGALRQKGLCQAQLGDHEAALDSFVAACALAPKEAELRLAVAQSFAKLGRHDAAENAFDETLRLRPEDQEALFGRAESLMALRRDELAVAAWNEVLRAKDNRTLSLHGRTVRVLTHDHRRLHALLSQALALGRLGRPEAAGAFRDVFDAHPQEPAGPAFNQALRELEVARSAYRAHLEANAGDPHTWKRAAQIWQAVSRADEAISAWDRVLAHTPSDARGWFGKAEAHAQAGQLDAAIAAYEHSLEYWPDFLGAAKRLIAQDTHRKLSARDWKRLHEVLDDESVSPALARAVKRYRKRSSTS